jgi:hypothetical protein
MERPLVWRAVAPFMMLRTVQRDGVIWSVVSVWETAELRLCAVIAARLVVTRRALDHRVTMLAVPADSAEGAFDRAQTY